MYYTIVGCLYLLTVDELKTKGNKNKIFESRKMTKIIFVFFFWSRPASCSITVMSLLPFAFRTHSVFPRHKYLPTS